MASPKRPMGPQPGDLLKISQAMTMVAVGDAKAPSFFNVHTDLLRTHSTVLAAMIGERNVNGLEGMSSQLTMLNVGPVLFKHVFSWLYTGVVLVQPPWKWRSAREIHEDVLQMHVLLYRFAYHYDMPALRYDVMIKFHGLYRKDPVREVTTRAFLVLPSGSSMLSYIAEGIGELWEEDGSKRCRGATEPPKEARAKMEEVRRARKIKKKTAAETDGGVDDWVEVAATSVFLVTDPKEVELMIAMYEDENVLRPDEVGALAQPMGSWVGLRRYRAAPF